MRHYMVDPDNEERLLKIPPRVVAAIKAEAYAEAVNAVKASDCWCGCDASTAVAAIEALGGER